MATDDVGKLIEIPIAHLIKRLIALDIDVAVILHAGAGRDQTVP